MDPSSGATPALLRWLGLGRGLARVQGLQQAEESGGFTDAAELDAEGLDLDEQVLDVDDLVPDQRLKEDADQPDQPVLEGEETAEGSAARLSAAGSRTRTWRTCMYLSLICSQVEIQLEMYRWMNSGGRSTAVVSLRPEVADYRHRPLLEAPPPAGH